MKYVTKLAVEAVFAAFAEPRLHSVGSTPFAKLEHEGPVYPKYFLA